MNEHRCINSCKCFLDRIIIRVVSTGWNRDKTFQSGRQSLVYRDDKMALLNERHFLYDDIL